MLIPGDGMSAPILCEPVHSGAFSPLLVASTPVLVASTPVLVTSTENLSECSLSTLSSKDTPPTIISENSSAADRSISPISDQSTPQGYDHPRRFPCKARGITDYHNARTAYIDIPANAAHGMLLICSHRSCSSSGRKFRYCALCELPVAKRNFFKRHSHGIRIESPAASATWSGTAAVKEVPGECAVEDSGSSTRSFKRQRLSHGDALRLLQEQQAKGVHTGPDIAASNPEELQVPRTVVIEPPAPSATCAGTVISTTLADLTDKELNWLSLYRDRPASLKNDQDFRVWMDTILETAEISCEGPNPSNVGNDLDNNDHDEVDQYLDVSDMHDLLSQYFDTPF